MAKYNLFRINKSFVESMKLKLLEVGLEETGSKVIGANRLSFYLSTEPDSSRPDWADLYEDYMAGYNPKNLSQYSIFLIENSHICYAVSMGKSHFYLREFCDPDFGINLAERIADKESVSLKNSHLFGGKRHKLITTYGANAELDYDSGESIQFIKCATSDKELWGKTASFGSSAQLTLSIEPDELPQVIERIEEELLKTPLIKFPRSVQIRDKEKINQLNEKLVGSLLSVDDVAPQSAEYVISGVDFIFLHKFQYQFRYKKKVSDVYDELTLADLQQYIREHNIDLLAELDNVRVTVCSESRSLFTKPLKYFLYYVDDDNQFLYEGSWYQFNQEYLSFLMNQVDERLTIEHDINLSKSHYEEWKATQPEDSKLNYLEYYFNVERENLDGYLNMDRFTERLRERFTIEKADLYKDETLYFVKIGTPKKLSYVIDQSLATVKVFQAGVSDLEIEGKKIMPKTMCIWIILDRKGRIQKLSEIDSLIFLIKLDEWRKVCAGAGFKAIVKIGYLVE